MALRAREIYYFVRIGNYASRPLRALATDFSRLGAEGDAAATKLAHLEMQQAKLSRSIAMRQTNIPATRESNLLRQQERQLALQRENIALANRRAGINQRIALSEQKIDQAVARGNILERERVVLESKQAAASVRARQALNLQQTRMAGQIAQAERAAAMFPAQRNIARLEQSRAIAQRKTVVQKTGLTQRQQEAALGGRISRSADIAGMQAKFLSAEKAVQAANLALVKLDATEVSAAEKARVLAASQERLVAAEGELRVATQQQQLALDKLDAKVVDNTVVMDNYRRQIQEFTTQLQLLVSQETRLSVAEQRLIADRLEAAGSIAKQNEELSLEVAELNRVSRAIAEQQAIISRHRWDRIGLGARALSDLGRTAQYAGGLTLIAFGLMARAAAKFQTQVTYAATQVGNNFRQVQQATKDIGQGLLRQMQMFPASADDMAKASYDIYSSLTLQGNAQQQTAEGLKVLSVFNRAAVAGQTDLADVTNAGITILNQFGKTAKGSAVNISGLNKMMDQAFAAVRFGRETFQEFTTTLANAAPAAKSAHQSFADMAGTLAFLTRRLPVRQASVAYARLLEILQRSGKGLAEHGIAIRNQAGFMRPLDQIIGDIVKKFPQLAQGRRFAVNFFKEITKGSGTGTMGTIQARRALVFLVQQYGQYQHVLRQTTHDQGEFWKSFRALQASPEVKWKIFVNQLHALAIEIGQYAIPALIKIIGPIKEAVKWFESLSDSTKRHIAILAVWSGALLLIAGTAAVVIGSFTRMFATFAGFATKLGIIEKAANGARVAEVGLAAEAGFVTVETAGLAAVVAALLYLWIKYPKQVDAVVNSFLDLKGTSRALHAQIRDVRTILHALRDAINGVIGPLSDLRASMHDNSTTAGRLAGYLRRVLDWLKGIANIGPIKITLHFITKGLPNIPGLPIVGPLKTALDTVKHPVNAAVNAMFPGVKYVRSMTHDAAALAHHFDHAKKSADDFKLSVRGDTVEVHRLNRALAKALDKPRSQDIFQQARGGPAITANEREALRERVAHAAKIGHQQVLHNRTVQQWIRMAEKANRIARQHPRNLRDQIRAAQIMDQIQKRFTGAQLEGMQSVISADDSVTKKRISNVDKIAKKAKQVNKEVIDNMRQMYDQMQQANETAFGDITQGTRIQNALEFGAVPKPTDILADLRQQINKFRQWRKELEELSAKGVPFGMLQQLEQAGPQAEPLLRGILAMSHRQFRQYTNMFRQSRTLIKAATMFDFKRQLQDWRAHGRNAALQFMRGMQDEHSTISRQMRKIFTAWLKGNSNAELGGQTQHTHHRRHHPHHVTHVQHTVHEGNITIQDHGEDLSTKHRKARLMQKNRRANRLRWGNT